MVGMESLVTGRIYVLNKHHNFLNTALILKNKNLIQWSHLKVLTWKIKVTLCNFKLNILFILTLPVDKGSEYLRLSVFCIQFLKSIKFEKEITF